MSSKNKKNCHILFDEYNKIWYYLNIRDMNTLLEKYFDEYELSEKDRHEIRQIFQLLPIEKKRYILDNFEELVKRIKKVQEDIKVEQEILIWDAVSKIRNAIELAKLEQHLN